jgi:hypothetical protein
MEAVTAAMCGSSCRASRYGRRLQLLALPPDRMACRLFPADQVRISGETTAYIWGDRMIGIHHCPVCGCGTHRETLGEDFGKMAINARLLDNFAEGAVEVRKFDSAE